MSESRAATGVCRQAAAVSTVTWATDSATLDSVRRLDVDAAPDHRYVIDLSFMLRDVHQLLTHGLGAAERDSCVVVRESSDRVMYAITPDEPRRKCFLSGCDVGMSTARGGSSGDLSRTEGRSPRSPRVAKTESLSWLSPEFAQYLKRCPQAAEEPLPKAHEVRACVL